MAEIQTRPTGVAVDEFLTEVPEPRRGQAQTVLELMARATGEPAVMWGPAIIGFGSVRYEAKTTSGDMPVVSLSPRKAALTLYGVHDSRPVEPLLDELGPHTVSTYCLYLKSLDGVDLDVLERMVRGAWERADRS
jgi:hypothetical protein